MPVVRTRLAVGLLSLAVIGLELALMRFLSLRFWHHFAYMVISVALLGFGASGTLLTLLRPRILGRERVWLCGLAMAFAASIPLTLWAGRAVALDVPFLAWNLSGVGNALALELLMFVPFFLAASVVGVVLMDRPERIGGHYAANLVGSGLGAVAAVALMHVLSTGGLFVAMTAAGYVAAALLVPWRRMAAAVGALAVGAALVFVAWLGPLEPEVSQYKMLSLLRSMPGTEVIHRTEGPLGRIDVVAGPPIHYAPGLSLGYTDPVPPHALLLVDGDQTGAVYDCKRREDWVFLDHTTSAVAYHLRREPKVLVLGAGGGADIGLAQFHRSREVVALEMNGQIIEAMTGPLAERGGAIYEAPGVRVENREARGYLAAAGETFDVIQMPAIDAFGASGAGLYAAQESYLYTVESLAAMLDRLGDDGVLCMTRWVRTPPRDGLRAFDMAAEALRSRGLEPAERLAMIRSWVTVTVLAFRRPITPEEAEGVRVFSEARGFDLCYLPDVAESEVNRFHRLDRPHYFEAARALLGGRRAAFLANYLFEISAATDDRPYFFHFFRWRSLSVLAEHLGARSRAFLELGYLMLWAALFQAVGMAAVLILLPLAVRIKTVRLATGKAPTLAYFLMLGLGFMFLEMAFLQKLILYLAHPVYSAAVVISAFLIFAGLGSQVSRYWRGSPGRVIAVAGAAVVGLALAYLFVLDGWLALTQAEAAGVRFVVAGLTIAPLGVAMGHLFPLGLKQTGTAAPPLVPWAWAVNGFASVVATAAAPLVAMAAGFSSVTLVAMGCYVLAAVLGPRLPHRQIHRRPDGQGDVRRGDCEETGMSFIHASGLSAGRVLRSPTGEAGSLGEGGSVET